MFRLQGDLNLNIAEAHAFNTTDRFTLDVFVVNGWANGGVEELEEVLSQRLQVVSSFKSKLALNPRPQSPALCILAISWHKPHHLLPAPSSGAPGPGPASGRLRSEPGGGGFWRASIPH